MGVGHHPENINTDFTISSFGMAPFCAAEILAIFSGCPLSFRELLGDHWVCFSSLRSTISRPSRNQHGLKLRHNSILFMNTEHWGTVTFLVLLDAARFERDKPRLLATEVVASLVEVF